MLEHVLVWLCLACLASTMAQNRTRRDADSDKILRLEKKIQLLCRHIMMQQYYVEESIRSSGNSGLKRMRIDSQGTRSYDAGSYADAQTIAAMHNHPNHQRMLGFGEIVAVLNGVEFRTRHNDYVLKMRRPNRRGLQDVPLPEVPPEVLQYVDVDDQITEMREWFKAWRDQDYSTRDYRPYFRAVVCYLEGAWTHSEPNSIEEPFESARHHLDATSWLDLTEKIRFTSYSGSKERLENLAYLPTTIIDLAEDKIPILAQWNFRIMCQPLKDHLPLNRLRLVDDLKTRMAKGGVTMEEYSKLRSARYELATFDADKRQDGTGTYGLLDEVMEQIPGIDGFRNLKDDAFNDDVYHFNDETLSVPMNVGYYHRWYKVKRPGKSGSQTRHRGFSDVNMFVAQTTHSKLAGLSVESCNGTECRKWSQRWTYAIPLEIVYMTPLSNWNPYDIIYRGPANKKEGRKVNQGPNGKRNGQSHPNKAYNGVNTSKYFITPYSFFNNQDEIKAGDTVQDTIHVLDSNKNVRKMRNSGFWITMPDIPGVGKLRQRYPIMPLFEEGSAASKELEALKDIVLEPSKYTNMFYEKR